MKAAPFQYLSAHAVTLSEEEEKRLHSLAVADNTEARDRLILSATPSIKTAIQRLCTNQDLQEDLLQETLLRIGANWRDWKGHSRFSTWAFRIASNATKNELKRRDHRISTTPLVESLCGRIEDPGTHIVRKELWDRLPDLISRLSPLQQKVILTRFFADKGVLSYEESIRRLEMKMGTFKSTYNRAQTVLRKMLKEAHLTLPGED